VKFCSSALLVVVVVVVVVVVRMFRVERRKCWVRWVRRFLHQIIQEVVVVGITTGIGENILKR